MTKLSVNINKVATIRNARGGNIPDILQFAKTCEAYGAYGITVHPRPDGRHILYSDVRNLKKIITKEFNIEGYPSEDFIKLVLKIRPTQVTLVPDPPNVLTSNQGWDICKHKSLLKKIITQLQKNNIRTSLFVNTKRENILAAAETNTNRIELYTGPYALKYTKNREQAVAPYVRTAELASKNNLGLNAGHDLNLNNLKYFHRCIPNLLEVSIGQALIADALYYGIKDTIAKYLRCL